MVTGRYTAFSNNKKMVTILHRELERKIEKVKRIKLEVMQPKTKNNRGTQREYSSKPHKHSIVERTVVLNGR